MLGMLHLLVGFSLGGMCMLSAGLTVTLLQVLPSTCRATVGQVSGGGRTEKPMLKAGRAYHKYRVKRNSWPKVGVATGQGRKCCPAATLSGLPEGLSPIMEGGPSRASCLCAISLLHATGCIHAVLLEDPAASCCPAGVAYYMSS